MSTCDFFHMAGELAKSHQITPYKENTSLDKLGQDHVKNLMRSSYNKQYLCKYKTSKYGPVDSRDRREDNRGSRHGSQICILFYSTKLIYIYIYKEIMHTMITPGEVNRYWLFPFLFGFPF